jgi:ribosomal protein L2|tara:strand:+ start:586 stop:759 length:174 start_codon:yes stop_codon:yes gene_type:complete
MAITKVKYTTSEKKVVHVVYDNDNSVKITTLVNNPGNRDWDNIQEWLDAGNTIEEAD